MDTLGNKLKKLREEKGFTLEYVANHLNTTKTSIGRYEKDDREPKSDMLLALAEFYNVSTDYLLGKSDLRNEKIDSDIRKIQRARDNMSTKEKDKMMKVLETMFDEYF